MLAESFAGREHDLTEENLQARIRGVLLMALSNKFGWLVVATGNKSELSVGYATLYGDMAGGFALLKDVFKTDVFRLARHLNERAGKELIPATIIGSWSLPGWFESFIAEVKAHPERFGTFDREEATRDAVRLAVDDQLRWVGVDDRGLELEINAVVLPDRLLVIHVMPTNFRRRTP